MQTTLFKKIIITIFVIHVHKLFVCFNKKSTLEYDFKCNFLLQSKVKLLMGVGRNLYAQ